MKSKTQQISEALAAGDRMNALRIASRFHDRSRDTMIYKREPLTQLVDRARLAERASVQGEQEISANSHSGLHRTGFEFADFPNHWVDLGHLKQTEQHLLASRFTAMSNTPPVSFRSHHDMGGEPGGAVEAVEHDYALWEKRVDALLVLLSSKGRMTVDELRRNIETLGPGAYDKMTYYERWIYAVAQTLVQRGYISVDELGRKIAEVQARS